MSMTICGNCGYIFPIIKPLIYNNYFYFKMHFTVAITPYPSNFCRIVYYTYSGISISINQDTPNKGLAIAIYIGHHVIYLPTKDTF